MFLLQAQTQYQKAQMKPALTFTVQFHTFSVFVYFAIFKWKNRIFIRTKELYVVLDQFSLFKCFLDFTNFSGMYNFGNICYASAAFVCLKRLAWFNELVRTGASEIATKISTVMCINELYKHKRVNISHFYCFVSI